DRREEVKTLTANVKEGSVTKKSEKLKPERIKHKIPLLHDTVTKAYDENGVKKILFDPKGNLTASQVTGMYSVKRAPNHTLDGFAQNGLLCDLPKYAKTPIDQIRLLQKNVVDCGGKGDSSRKVLAGQIAKLITAECDLKKMQAAKDGKELLPLFKFWTWLS